MSTTSLANAKNADDQALASHRRGARPLGDLGRGAERPAWQRARRVPQGLLPALAGARPPERPLLQRPGRNQWPRNRGLRAAPSARPRRALGSMGEANPALGEGSRPEDNPE